MEYLPSKKQCFILAPQLLFLVVFFCLLNVFAYAQKTNLKIDTVKMQVNIGVFTGADLTNPRLIDINKVYIIKPAYERFNISKLFKEDYKHKFDGIFIINDDQLLQYGIIIKKSGEFKTTNDPLQDKIQFRPLKSKISNFKYFCGFTIVAVWIKYEIEDFEAIEISQKKIYNENAKHKDGPYNYYVIKSIEKIQTFYK